jgi:hypothetical protein
MGALVITEVLTIVWIFFSSSSSESVPEKPEEEMMIERLETERDTGYFE